MASPTPVLPLVPSTIVPPGLKQAFSLGVFNHPPADSIFDRAARIHEFKFDVEIGVHSLGDSIESDDGSIANHLLGRFRTALPRCILLLPELCKLAVRGRERE